MKPRIRIDESRLNFPLIPIAAGVLSSLDVEIVDVPDVESLAVFFEHGDGTTYYQVACAKERVGFWTCYGRIRRVRQPALARDGPTKSVAQPRERGQRGTADSSA